MAEIMKVPSERETLPLRNNVKDRSERRMPKEGISGILLVSLFTPSSSYYLDKVENLNSRKLHIAGLAYNSFDNVLRDEIHDASLLRSASFWIC